MSVLTDIEPHYTWLAIGLVLAVAEMAIPGVFLIWMAGAALITGVLTWVVPVGLPLQIVVFAVLSILAVFLGRRYLVRNPVVSADPLMNRRADRAVGETVMVTQAILDGAGRVRLGDSEWIARGDDAAVGTRLIVVGIDGTALVVRPRAGREPATIAS